MRAFLTGVQISVQVIAEADSRHESTVRGGAPWLLLRYLAASKRHNTLAAAEAAAKVHG